MANEVPLVDATLGIPIVDATTGCPICSNNASGCACCNPSAYYCVWEAFSELICTYPPPGLKTWMQHPPDPVGSPLPQNPATGSQIAAYNTSIGYPANTWHQTTSDIARYWTYIPYNASSTLTISGSPTAGTFQISVYTNEGFFQLTSPLAFNVSAGAMETAIQALSNVGVGKATVTLSGTTYTIRFDPTLCQAFISPFGSLTGGTISSDNSNSACCNTSSPPTIPAASIGIFNASSQSAVEQQCPSCAAWFIGYQASDGTVSPGYQKSYGTIAVTISGLVDNPIFPGCNTAMNTTFVLTLGTETDSVGCYSGQGCDINQSTVFGWGFTSTTGPPSPITCLDTTCPYVGVCIECTGIDSTTLWPNWSLTITWSEGGGRVDDSINGELIGSATPFGTYTLFNVDTSSGSNTTTSVTVMAT